MGESLDKLGIPAQHYPALFIVESDAPDAHAIAGIFMESGLSAYTSNEIWPVLSMD